MSLAFDSQVPLRYDHLLHRGVMKEFWRSTSRNQRWVIATLAAVIMVALITGLSGSASKRGRSLAQLSETPSPVPTAMATASPSATATTRPTETATPTATATLTSTPSPSATPTLTHTASPTPTATCTLIPLPTPDGVHRAMRLPILMYHYISEPPDGADAVRRDLSITPEQFEAHLQYLAAEGYTTITLHDLALALQIGYPLPPKPVILTFDDGYRDHYTNAFPLLVKYGHVGTFFLITSALDEENPRHVTWDQVIEMHQAGMEMEAHCYTHVDLHYRTIDYLIWQMVGSKEAIEERINRPVRFFCYPSGRYDDLAIEVLHSAHYWGAVTVTLGVEHSSDRMFQIERIRIRGGEDAGDLQSVLERFMGPPEAAVACTLMPSA